MLGVDLASQATRTAACLVEWGDSPATIEWAEEGLDDDALLRLIRDCDVSAIDCPLGWPDAFVDAVFRHARGEPWPQHGLIELRYRHTDRVVAAAVRRPLSVSSDLIAIPAFRCARLLSALAADGVDVDRAGTGRVVEAYPAAALVGWGLDPGGYKRPDGRSRREALLDALVGEPPLVESPPRVLHALIGSDHCFDAFVCALVARAATLGLTAPPPEEAREVASREGWIHLPREGSLRRLAGPSCSLS